ncbi:hypothetical protein [Paracoccus sp. ME4]|uniref:hypothetical protein n=1 Tax=Paracoccus sp. ME4 TaxID=3138066 RepID=UPI00398B5103
MDRMEQLRSVVSGQGWSPSRRDEYDDAITLLRQAPELTLSRDLRGDEDMDGAIELLCEASPKGDSVRKSWDRALGMPDPVQRSRELIRIVRIIEMWVSD